MTDPNCHRIYEILTRAYETKNCDFKFVLRNMLGRAAEEANHLSFEVEGDGSEEFRRIKIYLEGIITDLP